MRKALYGAIYEIGKLTLALGGFALVGCVWLLIFRGTSQINDPGSPALLGLPRLPVQLAVAAAALLAAGGALWKVGLEGSRSPICRAAKQGDVAALENAIREAPGQLEESDASGDTPLVIASETGQVEVVRALLRHGVDPNRPGVGEFPVTALYRAAGGGHAVVVEMLLDAGAVVAGGPFDPLESAINGQHVDAAIRLIGRVNDVNRRITFRLGTGRDASLVSDGTYLMLAASKEVPEIVRALLLAGADPQLKSSSGAAAVAYASHERIASIIRHHIASGTSLRGE